MLISLILPWLFKLCAGFPDIFMIGLWLQPNPVSSVDSWHLVNTQTHAHTLSYCSSHLPVPSSCPLHPCLTSVLCSLLKATSCLSLSALFLSPPTLPQLPGSPQFSVFGPPSLRCDQWSLNKCWDWTSVGQHQPPACLLRCNHMACVLLAWITYQNLHQWQDIFLMSCPPLPPPPSSPWHIDAEDSSVVYAIKKGC